MKTQIFHFSDEKTQIFHFSDELLVGCRVDIRVDPTDARFQTVELRTPTAMPAGSEALHATGLKACEAAFQQSIGTVLGALMAHDQDLANDVIDAFKDLGALPEDFSMSLERSKVEPPS